MNNFFSYGRRTSCILKIIVRLSVAQEWKCWH